MGKWFVRALQMHLCQVPWPDGEPVAIRQLAFPLVGVERAGWTTAAPPKRLTVSLLMAFHTMVNKIPIHVIPLLLLLDN